MRRWQGSEPGAGEDGRGGFILGEGSQKGGHGLGLPGKDEIGADVVEGLENEAAKMEARVGEDEVGLGKDRFAEIEQIGIEGARAVSFRADAAAATLDLHGGI